MPRKKKVTVELDSVFTFSALKEGEDHSNRHMNLHSCPVSFNMTLDKAMISLESSILAYFAYINYPDELLRYDTISTDQNLKKYTETKVVPIDSDTEGCVHRRKVKNPKGGFSLSVDCWDESRLPVKKCSDVLAFVEYYMNRLTSVNDNTIKTNMISARHVLSELVRSEDPRSVDHKDFKDNPLVLSSEEMDNVCTLESDLFNDSPTVGFRRMIEKVNLFEHIDTFCDVADKTMIYVRLNGNNGELNDLYERFWGDSNQKDATNRYIPLMVLIDYLVSVYRTPKDKRETRLFRTMGYTIKEDIADFEHSIITPLDPFLGHIGSRDDNFETSHSLTSKIFRQSPDYCRKVITFARILHGIIMDAKLAGNDRSKFELTFDASSNLLKMMDPHLFDRNYPPTMVFCGDIDGTKKDYEDLLISKGYKKDEGGFIRRNQENPIAVNWPDTSGNTDNVHERSGGSTLIRVCRISDANALRSITESESKNNHVIIVTNWDSLSDTERIISDSTEDIGKIDYVVVLGRYQYITIRHDFHEIIEIGIKDIDEIYRLHRNDIGVRRLAIIESTIKSISGYFGIIIDEKDDLKAQISAIENGLNGDSLIEAVIRSYFNIVKKGLQ